ncbi:autotransporter outer membrane beta-barrel domain-containing protein [Helicobacter pametensis]|uniref:autotransporter outer membrane beta-barrel domain-containing protein n=1 Tax=Helicobacter pametensis TaxID=95149 RepID=UPI0004807978|nr:autotransporter outer membrane beta-barrel domain-containing protein [Helicobacter pametensis]
MKRLMPALTLSALLVGLSYGEDWSITDTQTKTITGQTIDSVSLTGSGKLTVESSGTNTINKMIMAFFQEGAGATFNVNSGSLDLDLSIANMSHVKNHVKFDIKNGATLTLTSGKNNGKLGIFSGVGTDLDAQIKGTLVGSLSNDGSTNIVLTKDAQMQGNIIQTAGTLEARIEGILTGGIQISGNTRANILGNENQSPTNQTITITGNVSQSDGKLNMQMGGLHLKGTWMQTGGESDVEFKGSKFDSSITISNAVTEMDFRNSTLQAISVTGYNFSLGRSSISLYEGSKMDSFAGNNSKVTLSLTQGSSMSGATQNGGDFTLSVDASTVNGSISANSSYLTVTLNNNSNLNGGITNSEGTGNFNFKSSTIRDNVMQTNGTLYLEATSTKIGGMFSQSGGNFSKFHLSGSTIAQGVLLTGVTPTQFGNEEIFRLSNGSVINNGVKITNGVGPVLRGTVSDSTINGGYEQVNDPAKQREGKVQLRFIRSSLNGGVRVKDGNGRKVDEWISADYITALEFESGSTLNGGAISENHALWLRFDRSTGNGGISATGGDLVVRGDGNSKINGSITSRNTTQSKILLYSGTQLHGSVTQEGGRQDLRLDNGHIFGGVNNRNTDTRFYARRGSRITGSYTQNGGSLRFEMGGGATINGSVTLNNVITTMSNGNIPSWDETIKGNFTQNGGSLGGWIAGLKLNGTYRQKGGTSNITYAESSFAQPTFIDQADSTKITFDHGSNLKSFTITDSNKKDGNGKSTNHLKLDRSTTLHGNFTLIRSSSKLTVINRSRITGNVISKDKENEIDIEIGGGGSIGGNIEITGGKAEADINGGNIGGDIKLVDATSHFHFKDSTIGGSVNITRGNTVMTLDRTSIGKGFEMTGKGEKNPSLVLTISNGSTITGDVNFSETDVYLGGMGEGSVIQGNLISTNTNLINTKPVKIEDLHPGKEPTFPLPASGLTIEGDFKQEGGTLDFVMTNKSGIIGETSLSNSKFSHLKMDNASTLGKITIDNVSDALIFLDHGSSQKAGGDGGQSGITLIDSKVVLKGFNGSSFTSDVKVVSNNNFLSDTKIYLDNRSQLAGNITQSSGTFLLDGQNFSEVKGNINISNVQATINLNNRSKIFGDLTANKSTVNITLNNASEMHSNITSTATPLINVNAHNGSILAGSITHAGAAKGNEFNFKMNFTGKSTLQNTTTTINGAMQILSNNSTINSDSINLAHGRFELSLDNRSDGVIKSMTSGGVNAINISTTNFSDSVIENLTISDRATLTLVANTGARISGSLFTKESSSATLVSLGNATINFDITPEDQSILKIALNGGKLMGRIIQGDPKLGEATLGSSGGFGGRWIMTGDSALKSLSVSNSPSIVQDETVMFMSVEDSPISMVDMTRDRNEAVVGRRIGKSMITPGITPQDGQTNARTLHLGSLGGLNGVFRVYTDIGAELSDKIAAQSGVGEHIIQVYYNPATYTTNLDGKYIVVAHIDDEGTTANFVGGPTEMGNHRYETELAKVPTRGGTGGWDWILGNIKNTGPSYGTKVIASILQSQYRSFAIQTETLNQRLGELKDLKRIDGLWARYYMGVNSTRETNNHIKVDDSYYSGWLGYDQNSLSLRGQNFLGFALSYALVNPNSKDYTGSIHNIGFNFYDVFVAKNDFYVDIVAKYILSYGMYDISYYSLAKNSPKYYNHKFMVNAEIGKKFKLGQKRRNYFYLQPEAQITSGYILGNELDFIDASNTNIHAILGDTFPVIMRAGLIGAYAMEYFSFKGDIRLGASFVYEVGTGGSVDLDDGHSIVSYKYGGDFHLLLQAGANFILNDSSRVYLEASTGFFGDTNTAYAINAGVRFNFGPKNTRRLKVPSSMPPPPPPPKPEYDPRNIPVITDNTKTDIRNNNEVKKTPAYSSDYFINTRKNFRDSTSIKR